MSEAHSEPNPLGFLLAGVPHAEALKIHVISLEAGKVICRVPFSEHLIGNPDTRVIHGGVITALLDNACGISVGSKTMLKGQIATLDLRIDYMKSATPDLDILAFAECFKVTRNIAFTRGVAYHTDRDDPIATCAAAFMLRTRATSDPTDRMPGAQ
ncbi:MAG: PaaI family thioesterase [Micropepsaceae bacterium]